MTTNAGPAGSQGDRGRGALRAAPPPPTSRATRRFLWIFSVAMVATAGTAFTFKLIEFIHTATMKGPSAMGSFLIPVLNYLIVAAGFGLLFTWAYLSGQFRDLESAKYRMLEMQRTFDRDEAAAKRSGS